MNIMDGTCSLIISSPHGYMPRVGYIQLFFHLPHGCLELVIYSYFFRFPRKQKNNDVLYKEREVEVRAGFMENIHTCHS